MSLVLVTGIEAGPDGLDEFDGFNSLDGFEGSKGLDGSVVVVRGVESVADRSVFPFAGFPPVAAGLEPATR